MATTVMATNGRKVLMNGKRPFKLTLFGAKRFIYAELGVLPYDYHIGRLPKKAYDIEIEISESACHFLELSDDKWHRLGNIIPAILRCMGKSGKYMPTIGKMVDEYQYRLFKLRAGALVTIGLAAAFGIALLNERLVSLTATALMLNLSAFGIFLSKIHEHIQQKNLYNAIRTHAYGREPINFYGFYHEYW